MNKIEKGKARTKKLATVLSEILSQDDDALRKLHATGLIDNGGKLSRKSIAEAVGLGCVPDTLRQNNAMKTLIKNADKQIQDRCILPTKIQDTTAKTKESIGKENEERFLSWLTSIGTNDNPAPANHNNRLYRKALWAMYSEQELVDVKRTPTWFTSRDNVKSALDELDVKVVQGDVSTLDLSADSITDDMEGSMTSSLVRRLQGEIKDLKEKLHAEKEARKDAELKSKQNKMLAGQVTTGKVPH